MHWARPRPQRWRWLKARQKTAKSLPPPLIEQTRTNKENNRACKSLNLRSGQNSIILAIFIPQWLKFETEHCSFVISSFPSLPPPVCSPSPYTSLFIHSSLPSLFYSPNPFFLLLFFSLPLFFHFSIPLYSSFLFLPLPITYLLCPSFFFPVMSSLFSFFFSLFAVSCLSFCSPFLSLEGCEACCWFAVHC